MEVNPMDNGYLIFEKYHGIENNTLSLGYRVIAVYHLVQVFQVNIPNIVLYIFLTGGGLRHSHRMK
jgi:hypothetical protein